MKKHQLFWCLLNSVFLIIFNLYFFLLKDSLNETSVWISYASIHFAYFMLLATPYFVRKGRAAVDYGRPLFTITATYFFIAFIVGVIFIIMAPDNYTAALLIQITVLAIFLLLLISNLIANQHTADNVEKREVEFRYVKEASSKLKLLLNLLPDRNHQKVVEKAYDLIDSSNVKSSHIVQPIEQKVFDEISILEGLIMNKSYENLEETVNKIYYLAEERNRQLKLLN